jgi:hypothetical protein
MCMTKGLESGVTMWKMPLVYVFQIHIATCNVHLLPTSFGMPCNNVWYPIFCGMPQICCMRHQEAMCNTPHAAERHAACCTLLPECNRCLTHGHLLCGELASMCINCGFPLCHLSWLNAYIMLKPALHIILTVVYLTCLVMITIAFIIFLIFKVQ